MLCNWRRSRITQVLNHTEYECCDLSRLDLGLVEKLSGTKTKLQHLGLSYLAARVDHQGKRVQARLTA